ETIHRETPNHRSPTGVGFPPGVEPDRKEMTMRATDSRRMTMMLVALGTVLGIALGIPAAAAGASDRAGHWQMTIPMTFTSGASYSGDGGTTVDVDNDLGWGFGFGYHLNPKLFLGVDFTWLNANYNAHVLTDSNNNGVPDGSVDVSGTLDAANTQGYA